MNKEIKIVLGLVRESISFAFSSIRTERLRTFLSLFGVTIGIFSIVTVFCVVDSLRSNILEGVKSFGSDVVYINTFPMVTSMDDGNTIPWWEYFRRPPITQGNFEFLAENSRTTANVVYTLMGNSQISLGRKHFDNAIVLMTTDGLENVMSFEVSEGRNFSTMEYVGNSNVALLGAKVASSLFGEQNAIGKKIKIEGSNTIVVGILKKQGESMASFVETDNAVIIPINYGKNILPVSEDGGLLIANPKSDVSRSEFIEELRLLLRKDRRLSPVENDNFAINEMTMLLDMFNNIFSKVMLGGWVIGAFSLLIGAFGIANIMFVSVQEKINQIGIQKSLGAKKYVIVTQFLVESSFFSFIGGLLGLLMVYGISIIFNAVSETFAISISLENAIQGMLIAIVIGLLSGIIPALKAANLNPVEAINA